MAMSNGVRPCSTAHREQLIGILRGERPPRMVNPEVWPAYVASFEAVMGFPANG